MKQLADDVPMLTLLDSPVPHEVDQLVAVLTHFDLLIPEQVIAVPKISYTHRFSRCSSSYTADGGTAGGSASSRPLTFQLAQVVFLALEVTTVFSQDRVLLRLLPSRPWTLQFPVVVFLEVVKVLTQDMLRYSVLWSRTQTFLFPAHVLLDFFTVFTQEQALLSAGCGRSCSSCSCNRGNL